MKSKYRVWVYVVLMMIILLAVVVISVNINRNLLDDWNPSDSLMGKWTGQAEVFAPFKKGVSPSEFPEDWIDIEIGIDAVGKVTGKIGQAEFVDCEVKQNRNWFERTIGIKTDYVIRDCFIRNGISQADTTEIRDISIPFNLIDGGLRGSIFEMEAWKYPDPLFPRMELTREDQ